MTQTQDTEQAVCADLLVYAWGLLFTLGWSPSEGRASVTLPLLHFPGYSAYMSQYTGLKHL